MKSTGYLAIAALLVPGCKKEYDHPPLKEIAESEKIAVAALRSRATPAAPVYEFTGGDTSLYCTVTADESTGSLYKQIYVRDDEGGAIQVNLLEKGGLYVGDRIRINLNGTTVSLTAGMYSLDAVDLEKNVVKLSSGSPVPPKPATIAQILNGTSNGSDLQSQLVEISGAEFTHLYRGVPLAPPAGKKELVLSDCNSNTITLTTSAFANYRNELTPAGNGKITAIVTRYENHMDLALRQHHDIVMQLPACTGSATSTGGTFVIGPPVAQIAENFSGVTDLSDFSEPGWINYSEKGKARWKGNVKAVIYKCVRATAYGTGEQNLSWLISPPVTYKTTLRLSFKSGIEYFKAGHAGYLVAYVSTNFNGLNFKTANWTAVSGADYAGSGDGNYSGAGGLRNSGEISLKDLPLFSGYSGQFFVAFRYSGEPGFDTNVYLDDVVIQ